jgi:hypothetical protein
MVEQHHAIGEQERVMVRQRRDTGSESDPARAFGRSGDEDFGRRYDLTARGVVFADPRLVVPELVEALDQLKVAVKRECWVLVGAVERGEKDPESHLLLPWSVSSRDASC